MSRIHRFVIGLVMLLSVPHAHGLDAVQTPGLELASQHLPELVPVLNHLRSQSPQRYEKAIRDLDRSAKKLEAIQRRDAQLFELSLQEWKFRGKLDLLKAKLKVKHSAQNQQQVLTALQSLRDAQLARIDRELAMLDERKAACEERIRQSQQLIDRGVELRAELENQRSQLMSEPIDQKSSFYLKAIGVTRNDPTQVSPSLKLKSKKAFNDE